MIGRRWTDVELGVSLAHYELKETCDFGEIGKQTPCLGAAVGAVRSMNDTCQLCLV